MISFITVFFVCLLCFLETDPPTQNISPYSKHFSLLKTVPPRQALSLPKNLSAIHQFYLQTPRVAFSGTLFLMALLILSTPGSFLPCAHITSYTVRGWSDMCPPPVSELLEWYRLYQSAHSMSVSLAGWLLS